MHRLIATALLTVLVAVLGLPAFAAEPKAEPHLLDRFKALAGEWSGAGVEGKSMPNATVSYSITAGGNAVEELDHNTKTERSIS